MVSQKFKNYAIAAAALFAVGTLAACGGGGGGGSSTSGTTATTALTVADKVSVVEAQSSATPKPTAGGGTAKSLDVDFARLSSDTQYDTDTTELWVYDPSIEAMGTVNMILCVMGQTGYDSQMNKGTYIALIDADKCETGKNESSTGSTGQSSTGGSKLETWIINSTRASDTADHLVKIWADQPADDNMPATRIFIYTVITAGASTSNPYGLFTMNFFGKAIDSSGNLTGTDRFKGVLAAGPTSNSGEVRFDFDMTEGDIDVLVADMTNGTWAFKQSATIIAAVDAAGDTSSGTAYTRNAFKAKFGGWTQNDDDEFDLAFNSANLLVNDQTQDFCLDRANFNTTIWRYGLYNATTGARVAVNSGFPITTQSGEYGWIGYWGLWVPEDAPSSDTIDGATITKIDYSGGSGTDYTLRQGPGKLIKYTKQILTLADLVGIPLNYWTGSAQTRVEYNGAEFQTLATFDDSTGQWTTQTAATFTLSAYWNGFWSDALGGNVTITTNGGTTVADITGVIYYQEEVVSGKETVDLTLFCFTECLEAPIDQASADWTGDSPFQADASGVGSPYTYVYDVSALTLFSGTIGSGNEVQLGSGITPSSSSPNQWGFRSGPMVTDTSGLTNIYDVWDESIYYVWETGSNSWNKFSAIEKAAGGFETFDKPLQFLYTHLTANDANDSATHDGKKFQLEYYGFGELGGIPWVGDASDRWYPLFGIKSGTVMGPNGTEYKIKALEGEQKPKKVTTTVCTADASPVLATSRPTAATLTFNDPYAVIGSIPTVTDPPAVVKGEVQ